MIDCQTKGPEGSIEVKNRGSYTTGFSINIQKAGKSTQMKHKLSNLKFLVGIFSL